ncbi:hypothetical protein PMY56_10545 [Clostridium tertium]|jgi:REase_MTES_1575|uniref:Restriction endonuclease type II-like domain-containing protein n=1 Tax=Clostridium tertium TaxID=1559 RepID=A0A9X3XPA5_9CLOT|nr:MULTISPECIES: hypothetical protein [Clostridium]EEH97875.1 hypothetical protein CSBG_01501 [Clostridium sp. 7_2_43FAA]MBS5307042.1 hypothetical protein [Clostridium sp.]MDB1922034.1 hypothetical protein [Clostridium tertium]MDB1926581.1 hypothetical protein [Clostridium tertium]MDB1929754.1 hypothetical protein [Clostridium tertium]
MVSKLVKEEEVLSTLSFDYIIESIIRYLKDNKDLIINNCSEEYLINIFECILYKLLFNENQVLILCDDYINKVIDTSVIKNLDKRAIYLKGSIDFESNLKERLLSLPEATGKTIISKVEVLSRSIDKKTTQLIDLIKFFTLSNNKSLSLIEKYKVTQRKLNKYDSLYEYYSIYRIRKPFEKYSYFEVDNCVNEIIKSDLIKKYIKYRRFIDNNKFKILKEPVNYEMLNLAIYKIDELNKDTNFKVPLNYSQYTEDFIETLSINQKMPNEDLKSLVNLVNLKYNYNLLTHQKKNRLLSIFTKRKDNAKYENNLNKYSSIEDDITKEYEDNLRNINSYIDKLNFLKNVLNDEEYKSFLAALIRGKDLKDDLLKYRKIFYISYEMRDVLNLLKHLSEIEIEILNYAYNNIEDKKYMEDIIISIPKLKLYLEIEEDEIRFSDTIDKYKDFGKLLNELNEDIRIRNSLISESINYIWDNKLREKLKIGKNNIDKVDFSDKEITKALFPCIISKLDNLQLKNINDNNIKFDKVIYLGKITNLDDKTLETLKDLSKSIIILCKDKVDTPLNLKRYENIDILNIDKSITYDNSSENIIINEIQKYLEGLGYISEKNVCIDNFNIELLIKDNNLNTIAALEIDSETININSSYKLKDIYLNKVLKDKNIKLYRVWSRDWWINKSKELCKLEEFLQTLKTK